MIYATDISIYYVACKKQYFNVLLFSVVFFISSCQQPWFIDIVIV